MARDRHDTGLRLVPKTRIFPVRCREEILGGDITAEESSLCIAGQILQGIKKPFDCPAFGKICTPENPLGATMVSSEGACAAYYRYSIQQVNRTHD